MTFHYDDWNRAGAPPQRSDTGAGPGHQDLRVERDEFRRIPFVERWVAASPAPVDPQIPTIVPIERAEPLHQGGGALLPHKVVWASQEHAEAAHPVARLRLRNRGRSASAAAAMPANIARRVVSPTGRCRKALPPAAMTWAAT